jgi:hypothetical protein
VPSKSQVFDSTDIDASIQPPSKPQHRSLLVKFLEAFRTFVNFEIPPMSEADEDYDEFGGDPKFRSSNMWNQFSMKLKLTACACQPRSSY